MIEDPNTGVVAWESGAVISYLLRKYDTEHALYPSPSEPDQVMVDYEKWIYFLVSTLGPMMGQVNWYRHYNPAKNEDALARYEEQARRCFMVLEGQLKKTDGKSILEGGYSAVDIHFYPWVEEHNYAELNIDAYPLVKKWLDNMEAREEVKTVLRKCPH